ncbi:MAG: SDR family NAD(P)-dependent oxidoreductase [Solirubrobacterales bacterium]
MEIVGKKVLLTGATGGLGRRMASTLAGAGAKMILSGRSEEALARLAAELAGTGHSVLAADLGVEGGAPDLAARAGDIDCLVHNAALPSTGRVTELTEEQISRMLRINLESGILLTHAFLPSMLDQGSGKFVMIGSLAGKTASPRSSVYNATKFGIRGFAFGLKSDLAGTGVGITLVAPGFVREAGMFADSGREAPSGLGTTSPGEVADAVLKAIREDKLEITVAPFFQKTMAHMGLAIPTFSHKVQSGKTGQTAAEDLAKHQADKR